MGACLQACAEEIFPQIPKALIAALVLCIILGLAGGPFAPLTFIACAKIAGIALGAGIVAAYAACVAWCMW